MKTNARNILLAALVGAVLAGCGEDKQPATPGGPDAGGAGGVGGAGGAGGTAGVADVSPMPDLDAGADAQTGDALGDLVSLMCDAQVCDDAGTCACATCEPGTLDCVCAETDAGEASGCGEDQICDDDGVCAECPFGTSGCLCVQTDAGMGGSCDNGNICDDEGICQGCSNDVAGCPCVAGSCAGGLACGAGVCRAPITCGAAGCVLGQACQEVRGEDATCLDSCEDGYSGTGLDCVAIPSCDPAAPGSLVALCNAQFRVCAANGATPACGACIAGPEVNGTCPDNRTPAQRCAAASRELVGMECGDCLPSHVEDLGSDTCVNRVTCAETPCAAGSACVEATFMQDAFCEVRACDAAEYGPDCRPCSQCYDPAGQPFEGVTGNLETQDGSRRCVCRLDPGYFQRAIDGGVQACDADGDGWTTDKLLPVESENGGNNPFNLNQTCNVRKIDRFELVGDDKSGAAQLTPYPVTVAALVDVHGLQAGAYLTDAAMTKFVRLIEPDALDVEDELLDLYDSEPAELKLYGAKTEARGGYRFTPVEVNPLTKACNHDDDDLNLDGSADTAQSQNKPYNGDARAAVFYHMAYYLEANRAYYRAPSGMQTYGAYVIVEKTRAGVGSNALEMSYPEDMDNGWDVCARSRDSLYDPTPGLGDSTQLGLDFARWRDCAGRSEVGERPGHCLAVDDRHAFGRYIAYDGRDRRTTVEGIEPDGQWAGMNHHGQFKCMKLVADDATATPAPADSGSAKIDQVRQRPAPADAGDPPRAVSNPNAEYGIQECRLNPPVDGVRDVDEPLGALIRNPADPKMFCNTVEIPADVQALYTARAGADSDARRSYWMAWKMPTQAGLDPASADRYVRGCINESLEWPFLCSGYDASPLRSRAFPTLSSGIAGQLICGCGRDRTGSECEVGCAGDHLFTGGQYVGNQRLFDIVPGDIPGALARNGCDASGFCPAAPEAESFVPGDPGQVQRVAAFAGGQRGYWMCGNSTASVGVSNPDDVDADQGIVLRAVTDGNLQDAQGRVLAVGGSALSLVGHVPTVGVVRQPMSSNQALPQAVDPDGELRLLEMY